jgi:hypothetical protein
MLAVRNESESGARVACIKLNLGAGGTHIEGFTPLDVKMGHEIFPLAYADGSVDEIRASHVLEHLPRFVTQAAVNDWARVLKPGGLIKIAVPDVTYAMQNLNHPHAEGWIMGGQTDEDDFHYALFNHSKLWTILNNAGLCNIHIWKSEINDCAALPVSLNLAGYKPLASTVNTSSIREVRL